MATLPAEISEKANDMFGCMSVGGRVEGQGSLGERSDGSGLANGFASHRPKSSQTYSFIEVKAVRLGSPKNRQNEGRGEFGPLNLLNTRRADRSKAAAKVGYQCSDNHEVTYMCYIGGKQ